MKYFLILLPFLISACNSKYDHTIDIPYYSECKESVDEMKQEYERKYKGTDIVLEISVSHFAKTSRAHPEPSGYITLSEKNLGHDIIITANTLAHKCYPESSLLLEPNVSSMSDILYELDRNKRRGKKASYIREENGIIHIHSAGPTQPGFR